MPYSKEYYLKNKLKISKYNKQWREDNLERMKKLQSNWRESNPEHNKQWCKNNPEKVKRYHRKYCIKKYKTDLRFNLNLKMGNVIRKSLKGNKQGWYWEEIVGYTLKDLIKRLKKTMPKGYIRQDYLRGKLQMDHIVPISAFNYTKISDSDFQKCWALDNLQLLSAEGNREKGIKLLKPFQPSLAIK